MPPPLPLLLQMTRPPGLNLGTYNIRDGRVFAPPPKSVQATQLGNYDLMIIIEMNIPYMVYFRNRLGCYIM